LPHLLYVFAGGGGWKDFVSVAGMLVVVVGGTGWNPVLFEMTGVGTFTLTFYTFFHAPPSFFTYFFSYLTYTFSAAT
jgi:hypothetical protein